MAAPQQRGSAAPNRRLTPIQEESLKQWVLLMDRRGMPPRIATVRQMASILASWGGPLACVGHWLVDHVNGIVYSDIYVIFTE